MWGGDSCDLARRRRRRNRKSWVDWISKRVQLGAYHKLVQELRMCDPQSYHHFLGMDVTTFDYLLRLVATLITLKDTFIRKAIPPAERLVLTLRFLATGNNLNFRDHQICLSVMHAVYMC